ncbi:hypothetical protein LTR62_005019 [Meristemomyces frigidus]|uniref:Methyltransferase type 11 domain-containing protein n=1 Tax=Meristemomyces frigidus TaxID=1508187 RepID=A0AAN7YKA4_9PEZI|nr:hypothetical protein LTR62_005019 [Meristemomyces frigidus]
MSTGMQATKGDDWASLAEDYAAMTAKPSLPPIKVMLSRANALKPFSEATGILDNGCGPGPVMQQLIQVYGTTIPADCTLTCSDFSAGMVAQVQAAKDRNTASDPSSPWKRVQTKVQDATDLTEIASESLSHLTAGLVYFLTPSPEKCLSESLRVLQPSGVLAVSAWKDTQWIHLMYTLTRIRPDKIMPTMPEAWTSTTGLKGEMEKAGFRDVETHEVEVEMEYKTYRGLADFMVGKLPHMIALTKDMSAEQVEKYKEIWIEDMKKMCGSEPGSLSGVALVGVGRK